MIGRLTRYVSITSVVLLLGVAWAGSQPGHGGHHGMHRGHLFMMHGGPDFDRMVEHMSRRLALDETQETAIRNIVDAAKPEAESLRAQAKANREAMHALDTEDENYDVKLQNLAIRNGELVTQLTLLHGRTMVQVNAELSDEQKEKFAEGRKRMHKRFRQHLQLIESVDDTTT